MPNKPTRQAPAPRAFLIGLFMVVAGVLGTLWWQGYQRQFVYAVTVDGAPVGCVASKVEWTEAVAAAKAWAAEQMGLPVALKSEVTIKKTRLPRKADQTEAAAVGGAAGDAEVATGPGGGAVASGGDASADPPVNYTVLSGDFLLDTCKSALNFVTQVWAVTVDGKDVAYLRTEKECQAVLPSLIEDYRRNLLAKGNTAVLEISVEEKVGSRLAEAPVSQVGDIEQAKRVLLRGTDKVKTHVVTRGESLWAIAASNDLTVADLRKANPSLQNSDLIRIGQELSLIVPDPYVTLKSRERYTYIRYLPYTEIVHENSALWPWQSYVEKAGVNGKMEVTVEISRTDGQETGRTVVGEKRLSSSKPQTFTVGTKVYPIRSDGLVWPAPGRITSSYGWRRREFHNGIDIGAPYGSSVLAARGGTVVFAGWRGGYGNCVVLDNGGGMETWYAHLSAILVSTGRTVARGDVLGRVGSTGNSTGPHLHFEVHIGGKPVNPLSYYPAGG